MARAFPLASFVFRPVNTFPSCISLNSIGMRNTQQCKKLEYPDQNFDDFRKLLKLQPQVFLSIMKNASLLAESFDRMLILVVIFITSTESFLCTIFFYGFLARDVLEIFGVKIKQQSLPVIYESTLASKNLKKLRPLYQSYKNLTFRGDVERLQALRTRHQTLSFVFKTTLTVWSRRRRRKIAVVSLFSFEAVRA